MLHNKEQRWGIGKEMSKQNKGFENAMMQMGQKIVRK
jgi:hypothetical protein